MTVETLIETIETILKCEYGDHVYRRDLGLSLLGSNNTNHLISVLRTYLPRAVVNRIDQTHITLSIDGVVIDIYNA